MEFEQQLRAVHGLLTTMRRRRFLSVAGGAGALTLAGCLGSGDPSSGSSDLSTTVGDGSGDQSIDTHPAATDLAEQPRKGDLGGHVVLAFEDPSCSRCRAFERQTVPKITERLVATGKAAFVVRTYPVVYQWGKPATRALEATFTRDTDAFWALLGHYFETQPEFSTDNVLDRTRAFLADETSLDGTEVVRDVEEDASEPAVQADLEAGRNADIGQTTPIVLLFNNGEYVTKASGSVSYDIVATALGEA